MQLKDSNKEMPSFLPGERVYVQPLKMEATVVEQLKCCDGADWYWANVKLAYDDGLLGISNTWQLKKISNGL